MSENRPQGVEMQEKPVTCNEPLCGYAGDPCPAGLPPCHPTDCPGCRPYDPSAPMRLTPADTSTWCSACRDDQARGRLGY
jgi:hypothetical protein